MSAFIFLQPFCPFPSRFCQCFCLSTCRQATLCNFGLECAITACYLSLFRLFPNAQRNTFTVRLLFGPVAGVAADTHARSLQPVAFVTLIRHIPSFPEFLANNDAVLGRFYFMTQTVTCKGRHFLHIKKLNAPSFLPCNITYRCTLDKTARVGARTHAHTHTHTHAHHARN